MGTDLPRSCPRPAPRTDAALTVSIRIDADQRMDDLLEAWAGREHRSKREHVHYLVREVLDAYRADPFVLHRLALARAGPATASRSLSA